MTTEKDAKPVVYIDGEFYGESDAKISVFDHALLYGDAIYETCCAWNGAIFKLDRHIDRLFESAHAVKLQVPLSKAELKEVAVETVRRSNLKNAYVKIIATRGVGEQPTISPYNTTPSIIVFAWPYLSLVAGDVDLKGMRVKVASWRRIPDICLPSKVKSINYLNHVLMRMEANESGYDDALELGTDGDVTEAPGYNVFAVKRSAIQTPSNNILVGITRETVLELAAEAGISVIEGQLTVFDFYNADEVFFSSSAGGIFPVSEIDGRVIGNDGKPGPVTVRIRDGYQALLESRAKSTPVYPA